MKNELNILIAFSFAEFLVWVIIKTHIYYGLFSIYKNYFFPVWAKVHKDLPENYKHKFLLKPLIGLAIYLQLFKAIRAF